jgi:hypothetical protein
VTSGAITKSAGSTPTAFMLWLWIMICRIMTDAINRPRRDLLRMPGILLELGRHRRRDHGVATPHDQCAGTLLSRPPSTTACSR